MVTCMGDCNFPLVPRRTRKSLDVVTTVFLKSFVKFQLGRQMQRVLFGKGKPAWARLSDDGQGCEVP